MHMMDCSCAPIAVFYSASGGATTNRQIPYRISWSLFTSLRKDSIANMHRFGRHFKRLLEDWMCFTKHYTFRSSLVCGVTTFANFR